MRAYSQPARRHDYEAEPVFIEGVRTIHGPRTDRPGLRRTSLSDVDAGRTVLVVGAKPRGEDPVVRALSRDRSSTTCARVTCPEDFSLALATCVWDVIVDDRSGLVTADSLRKANSDARVVVVDEVEGGPLGVSSEALGRLSAVVDRESHEARARRALLQRVNDDDHFFELGLDLYCIAGFDGRFKRVNPTWTRTLGWSEADLMAASWMDFVHPADAVATNEAVRRLTAEGRDRFSPYAFVNRYRCKDGGYRTLLWTVTVDGTQAKLYGVARDITRQKELEEQLLHAQKMEPVGRLAGGIAHDFNNLLTVILSATSSILPALEEESYLKNELIEVYDAAVRGAELTKQLLASSGRRRTLDMRVAGLNRLVLDMERLLRRTLGEDVELEIDCEPDTGRVFVDVGQLEQAIMNLAVNARDAMPSGGRLTIRTANLNVADRGDLVHPEVAPGSYVMLSVSDTGEGICPEVQTRIFEPFFTTKEAGRGTGLGLATVHDIIQRGGGQLHVDSVVGAGTTFTIYLPRTDKPILRETEPPPSVETPGGSETVLLVEDDRAVRALMRAGLRKNGYNVIEAENAGEALLLAEEAPRVDLLLTDVVMPRLSGRQLAERLQKTRPNLKVLYMSGYHEEQHQALAPVVSDAIFLRKPFTMEVLMQRVRTTLDTQDEGRAGVDAVRGPRFTL